MLCAYLDESGIHDRKKTGRVEYLAVGGAIAQCENWLVLEDKWRAALISAGISEFHMTDFESSKKEFSGWSKEKREDFLNQLLDIIHKSRVRAFFGAGTLVPSIQTGPDWFPEVYKKCVSRLIPDLMWQAGFVDQTDNDVNIVFAKHEQIDYHKIAYYFEAISQALPQNFSVTIKQPSNCPSLQVADIVVYETTRWLHDPQHSPIPQRYPLRHLYALGASVAFHSV